MTQRERAITAFHESGHALAYLHYRIPFKHVTIYNDQSGGLTILPYRATWVHRAILCLAGPASEARFIGQPITAILTSPHCATDLRMAKDALARIRNSNRYLQAILDRTAMIVAMEWPRIRLLAEALSELERLTYDEVCGILRLTPA